jgi:quinol-cytochrome oxidoreductase complex cytochrome b subunit
LVLLWRIVDGGLVNQLLTGFWLTMMYSPTAEGAFDSIEYIMRDVEYGWLIALYALNGRIGIFCGGLFAHVPWLALWLLSKAA